MNFQSVIASDLGFNDATGIDDLDASNSLFWRIACCRLTPLAPDSQCIKCETTSDAIQSVLNIICCLPRTVVNCAGSCASNTTLCLPCVSAAVGFTSFPPSKKSMRNCFVNCARCCAYCPCVTVTLTVPEFDAQDAHVVSVVPVNNTSVIEVGNESYGYGLQE